MLGSVERFLVGVYNVAAGALLLLVFMLSNKKQINDEIVSAIRRLITLLEKEKEALMSCIGMLCLENDSDISVKALLDSVDKNAKSRYFLAKMRDDIKLGRINYSNIGRVGALYNSELRRGSCLPIAQNIEAFLANHSVSLSRRRELTRAESQGAHQSALGKAI